MNKEILYFGCLGEAGHYLFSKSNPNIRFDQTPWKRDIDGGILKSLRTYRQGVVVHAQKDGWTAIDFWDNSVDSRPGSHSCFLCAALLTAEEMIALARAQWPEVFGRPRFPDLSYQPP